MAKPLVRRQDPYVALTKEQFRERFFARFYDPVFDDLAAELEKVFDKAWDGYYRPYATSHEALDADPDIFVLVRNAALALAEMVAQVRSGKYRPPDANLRSPRQK